MFVPVLVHRTGIYLSVVICLVVVYFVLQWTWGFLQNIIGLGLFVVNISKRHYRYKGAIVTEWHYRRGSVGLGMFIFVSVPKQGADPAAVEKTVRHEYGHTLQSVILGPLFLLVIGLPSLLWCACFVSYRRKNNVSYYRFYTERWANRLAKIDL